MFTNSGAVSFSGDAFVKFHGGEGYVPKESIGDNRVLEIYFIDVEQGDSILIETPDDIRILIDGGRGVNAHSFLNWKYNLKEHYKQIDALIISHGDEDHAEGLIPILNDKHLFFKSIYHNGIVARKKRKKLGEYKKENGKNLLYELINDLTSSEEIPLDNLTDYYRTWIEAIINVENQRAKELVSNIGFMEEGTLREYVKWKNEFWDMSLYSLIKKDWVKI